MPVDLTNQATRNRLFREDRAAGLPAVFTIGDSWFDYPVYPNIVDDLYFTGLFALCRREVSGAVLDDIAKQAAIPRDILKAGSDLLLVSGGGNDLVEKEWISHLFLPSDGTPTSDVDSLIDKQWWEPKLRFFYHWYSAVVNQCAPWGIRVVTHGYDYLIPSSTGLSLDIFYHSGPWVRPAMMAAGITDPLTQRRLARRLVDDFNGVFEALVREGHQLPDGRPAFHYIDCRGTLDDADWVNEMHPTKIGFEKVAARFVPVLGALLHPAILA
ncbi:MAG TPA: hypothetical protein VFW98_04765 [Gemmatimonadaceae bacterium]|nr:hypothetical protein [Gemmatimonadaceae bacterium]